MKKLLVVVDMQHDFVDGKLGSEEAKKVVSPVVKTIEDFDGDVIYTRDTHGQDYFETEESKSFPTLHCVKGTEGWLFVQPIEDLSKNHIVVEKDAFGSPRLAQIVKEAGYTDITMVGVCTDVCVQQNAMLIQKAIPQAKITVVSSCCAGTSIENHNKALQEMKSSNMFII